MPFEIVRDVRWTLCFGRTFFRLKIGDEKFTFI